MLRTGVAVFLLFVMACIDQTQSPDRPTDPATVARLVLRAPAAELRRLDLGYSDDVTVFLNGRSLMAGDAHYSFDRPRPDGLIGLWQSAAWLPLVAGDNKLLLAVADGFGGWGLTVRLDPAGGARVADGPTWSEPRVGAPAPPSPRATRRR